jgi:hypothetical protein
MPPVKCGATKAISELAIRQAQMRRRRADLEDMGTRLRRAMARHGESRLLVIRGEWEKTGGKEAETQGGRESQTQDTGEIPLCVSVPQSRSKSRSVGKDNVF